MRNLPIELQKELQQETAEHISKMSGNILLDTHLAIKTDFGYIPGFTEEMLNTLRPKAIILVDANEVEIRGRRKLDKTRLGRTIESSDEILEHKLINRSFAAIASSKTDSLLRLVQNHTGEFEEAISTVISCLDFVTAENLKK
ncbi:MAG: AAA family ATPase, partial [Candidatus Ranarchaeia archaeon]|jgi:adenylate kinase